LKKKTKCILCVATLSGLCKIRLSKKKGGGREICQAGVAGTTEGRLAQTKGGRQSLGLVMTGRRRLVQGPQGIIVKNGAIRSSLASVIEIQTRVKKGRVVPLRMYNGGSILRRK